MTKPRQPMIPTTITNEEFDFLIGNATQTSEVIARLERRELVERGTMGQTLTDRGLAVASGSPPADLVPFSLFTIGMRLVMAFSVTGPDRHTFAAGSEVPRRLTVRASSDQGEKAFEVVVRIDTPGEQAYYRHGGIMPYVLRSLL